jgi:hypothetical protein
MKISELIKELEKIKAEHGDLEVGVVDVDTSDVNFDVGVCKSVYCKDYPEKFEPDTELEETPYCEIYAVI